MADAEVLNLVATAVDNATPVLRQLRDQLDGIADSGAKLDRDTSNQFASMRRSVNQLLSGNEGMRVTGTRLKEVGTQFKGAQGAAAGMAGLIGKELLPMLTLATSAFVATIASIKTFNQNIADTKGFDELAKQTGLFIQKVAGFSKLGEYYDIPPELTKQMLVKITQEFASAQFIGNEFYNKMMNVPALQATAAEITRIQRNTQFSPDEKQTKSLITFQKGINNLIGSVGETQAAFLLTKAGIDATWIALGRIDPSEFGPKWEALAKSIKLLDPELVKRNSWEWLRLKTNLGNVSVEIQSRLLPSLTSLMETANKVFEAKPGDYWLLDKLREARDALRPVRDDIKTGFDTVIADIKKAFSELVLPEFNADNLTKWVNEGWPKIRSDIVTGYGLLKADLEGKPPDWNKVLGLNVMEDATKRWDRMVLGWKITYEKFLSFIGQGTPGALEQMQKEFDKLDKAIPRSDPYGAGAVVSGENQSGMAAPAAAINKAISDTFKDRYWPDPEEWKRQHGQAPRDTFGDRFGAWPEGAQPQFFSGGPGSEFPGDDRINPVPTDEQLAGGIAATNPYGSWTSTVARSGWGRSMLRGSMSRRNVGGDPNAAKNAFLGGVPMSTNIDDRRGENEEENTRALRDVTSEVKRLTDEIMRGGVGGMGGGGPGGVGRGGPGGGGPGTTGMGWGGGPSGYGGGAGGGPSGYGGGAGGGAAGGVPGGAGGPSGGGVSAENIPAGGPGAGQDFYKQALAAFQGSDVVGKVPPGGEKFGIKTGSAEEWARFATGVAKAESSFNPRSANTSDPGGSFGVLQYAHNQVPGRNAFDTGASIKAFVRDAGISASSPQGLGPGSLLARRFSTIGKHPERTIRNLANYDGGGGLEQQAGLSSISGGPEGAQPNQGNRPFYFGGAVDVGGQKFNYGTGGGGKGSMPYGTFPIDFANIGPKGRQQLGSVASVGPGGSIFDPKLGGMRGGIQIHPGGGSLDALYSAGCFKIPFAQWPAFKQRLLAMRQQYGKLQLSVRPGPDGKPIASISAAGKSIVNNGVPVSAQQFNQMATPQMFSGSTTLSSYAEGGAGPTPAMSQAMQAAGVFSKSEEASAAAMKKAEATAGVVSPSDAAIKKGQAAFGEQANEEPFLGGKAAGKNLGVNKGTSGLEAAAENERAGRGFSELSSAQRDFLGGTAAGKRRAGLSGSAAATENERAGRGFSELSKEQQGFGIPIPRRDPRKGREPGELGARAAAAQETKVNGTVNLNVIAGRGTKVSHDTEGDVFKDIKSNRKMAEQSAVEAGNMEE